MVETQERFTVRKYTRGRGSNPVSKANLKAGVSRHWWVWSRGSGIGWTPSFGPYTAKEAFAVVARLERFNRTGEALYAAQMGN